MIRKVKGSLRALVAITMVFLNGCGAAGILVVKSPERRFPVSYVNVYEANSPVSVPADIQVAMQQKLEYFLYRKGPFQKGSDLNIRYRFLQFDRTNALTRWLSSSGEGSLTIEAKFLDRHDNELAVVQVEGLAGQNLFARDLDSAIEKVAEKVAEYAEINYR